MHQVKNKLFPYASSTTVKVIYLDVAVMTCCVLLVKLSDSSIPLSLESSSPGLSPFFPFFFFSTPQKQVQASQTRNKDTAKETPIHRK
jgi:hypothetical protein